MSTPVASALPAPVPAVDRDIYRCLATRVKVLSWVSLAYMTLEGSIAIFAGVLAGSVALIGFGIDSAIEGFASAIIVWRFTGTRMFSDVAETRAQKLVAIQFFILAPYVAFESIQAIVPTSSRSRANLTTRSSLCSSCAASCAPAVRTSCATTGQDRATHSPCSPAWPRHATALAPSS